MSYEEATFNPLDSSRFGKAGTSPRAESTEHLPVTPDRRAVLMQEAANLGKVAVPGLTLTPDTIDMFFSRHPINLEGQIVSSVPMELPARIESVAVVSQMVQAAA